VSLAWPWIAMVIRHEHERRQTEAKASAARAAQTTSYAARPPAVPVQPPGTPAPAPVAHAAVSLVRASIHPAQVIPPPAKGGVVSSGEGSAANVPATLAQAYASAPKPPSPATPASLARYMDAAHKWYTALPPAVMKQVEAVTDARTKMERAKALALRPPPGAEPADQNAWLNGAGASFGGPLKGYPEFQWTRTGNGNEARGVVSRGSNDWVQWYQGPGWTWTYDHHYGGGFPGVDLSGAISAATNAVKSAASAAGKAIDTATQPFRSAIDLADTVANGALDTLAGALPPNARPFVESLKGPVKFLAQTMQATIDPTKVDWKGVADYVEAVYSTVPVLGTAAADIIATAEVFVDVVTAGNPLVAAMDAAYDYAMATIPGGAALRPFIDPVVNVLIDMAVAGQPLAQAVLTQAVQQAPTSPSLGNMNPRTVVASLATFLVHHLGLT
jgi:hypothetical protein